MLTPTGSAGLLFREAIPLKPYTTFKIGGPARFFVPVASPDDFRGALDFSRRQGAPLFVLGGGSNILVSDRGYDGVVAHPTCRGIEIAAADSESVTLHVDAAENWDDLVQFAVAHGWWGIENLSHIPGQAGAALVQNIGAYGQQVGDVVQSARVVEVSTGALRTLTAHECAFGYRRSIFNTSARGEMVIFGISLRLNKHARPQLQYPDLQAYFGERGTNPPSLQEIRQAIISIRDSKFPFPREERGGNAGSFFKNLTLTDSECAELHERIERNFSARELARLEEIWKRFGAPNQTKIPAAFLLDICGLRGHRVGGAQVNEKQPLVLLNQGGATAHDVLALAQHLRKSVWTRTGLALAIEPELVGFAKDEWEFLYNLN